MENNANELFNYFTQETGIEIPQVIVKHYLNGNNNNSQFIRLFKSEIESVKNGNYPHLNVLISEKFAKEILKLIFEHSYNERITTLFQKIFDYNNYGKGIKIDTSIEDFVIDEILYSIVDYNYRNDSFDFPIIQKAYENINSDHNEMKVVLVLSVDCGGEGGIIVRGKNEGFDINYSHTESLDLEFNGKKYEYKGFVFEEYEKLHQPIIEKA